MFDSTHLTCVHCGTRLSSTRKWKRLYYLVSFFSMLLIVSPSLLAFFDLLPYEHLLDVFFVVLGLTIILMVSLSTYLWKRIEYEIEHKKS
jgi:hypothetical protein